MAPRSNRDGWLDKVHPAYFFFGGLLAVVVGQILKSANDAHNALCTSGLGAVGQSISSSVQSQCNRASIGAAAGQWLFIVGILAVIVGIVTWFNLSNKSRAIVTEIKSPSNGAEANYPRRANVTAPVLPLGPASGWKDLLSALTRQSLSPRESLEPAASTLSQRYPQLRAWTFATGSGEENVLILLFDDKVIRAICKKDELPSIRYFYATAGIRLVARNASNGEVEGIGLGRQNPTRGEPDEWFTNPNPIEAVSHLINLAAPASWIDVASDRASGDGSAQVEASQRVMGTPEDSSKTTETESGGAGTGEVGEAADRIADSTNLRRQLQLLKSLREDDLIDDVEYAARKSDILDSLTTDD
jgi:hypothetical protein